MTYPAPGGVAGPDEAADLGALVVAAPAPVLDTSRARVVLIVVLLIGGLTLVLLALLGMLLLTDRAVPGELWLAFGNLTGGLLGLLVSTRTTTTPPQ